MKMTLLNNKMTLAEFKVKKISKNLLIFFIFLINLDFKNNRNNQHTKLKFHNLFKLCL